MDFVDIDNSIEELKRADGVGATAISVTKIFSIAAVNIVIFAGNEICSGRASTKMAEIVEQKKAERAEKD
jgi:hypothetical protein